MAVIHPKQVGEHVALDPQDQSSARRAFHRPPGTGPSPQIVGQRPPAHQMQTTQQAPTARDFARRMCIAVWHGGGWWRETIEMFDNFYSFDGLQDRSCYILSTPVHKVPEDVLASARRAFTDVRVVETNYMNPADGVMTPFALYEFAGLIPEKFAHRSRIFFTMPVKIVGPNSLTRLEQEAHTANPGRGKDQRQMGKCILGAIRGEGQNKLPFSSFVALPTWVREPEFPLAKNLSKTPITSADAMPLIHMRFEMMKHMQVTALINPDPEHMPSDPRWVLIEGRKFGERFPKEEPVAETYEPPLGMVVMPPFPPGTSDEPPPSNVAESVPMETPVPSPKFSEAIVPMPLPGNLEIEARIATEGLEWLKDYQCPTDLVTIKLIHNSEVYRRRRMADESTQIEQEAPKEKKKRGPKAKRALTETPA